MSEIPPKYICDWCGKEIDKEKYHRYEIKNLNNGSDDDGTILDCCSNCYNNKIAPKNFAKKQKEVKDNE